MGKWIILLFMVFGSFLGCQTVSSLSSMDCECKEEVINWDDDTTHLFRDADGKYYDVKLVAQISSALPIKCVSISRLQHNLDADTWGYKDQGAYRPLSAKRVMQSNRLDPLLNRHCCRIKQADLSFPILIMKSKDSNTLVVIDGMHRLAKAYQLNADCINAIEIPRKMISKAQSTRR